MTAGRKRPPHFVLDHGFPESAALSVPLPDIRFSRLRVLHPDLTANHFDWQILQQLRARGAVDGFITVDAGILEEAKEMVVLQQSRLSLVVLVDIDNDPLAAGGLVMAAAGRLASAFDRRNPQVFKLRPPRVQSERPWVEIARIAAKDGLTPEDLTRRERLRPTELAHDCRQA